jgi:hypothetical protein
MNLPEKLEAHRKLVAELERRQAELDAQRMGELAELPARFGFVNLDDFLRALRAATRAKDGPRVRKSGTETVGSSQAGSQNSGTDTD